jgi:hypothetical protein
MESPGLVTPRCTQDSGLWTDDLERTCLDPKLCCQKPCCGRRYLSEFVFQGGADVPEGASCTLGDGEVHGLPLSPSMT